MTEGTTGPLFFHDVGVQRAQLLGLAAGDEGGGLYVGCVNMLYPAGGLKLIRLIFFSLSSLFLALPFFRSCGLGWVS